MKNRFSTIGCGLVMVAAVGCHDGTPPPPTSSVPPQGTYTHVRGETGKPLPEQESAGDYNPPFQDPPLITQAPPEQPAFLDAYAKVGRPRIALFVNRTFGGEAKVPPTTPPDQARRDAGPGAIELPPPARIDYDAVETIMTDWFAGGGKVALVSAKLSEAQVKAVVQGEHNLLKQLSDKQQIDVLIFVQASETRQTPRGVEVRLIAEAVNTADGESIARAVVDAPPILEKRVINEYTRFLSRKLMKDMTGTWNNARPPAPTTPMGEQIPANPQPADRVAPVPHPTPQTPLQPAPLAPLE